MLSRRSDSRQTILEPAPVCGEGRPYCQTPSFPDIGRFGSDAVGNHGAVRGGAHTMAISNIFGTNSMEVAMLLPADLAYRRGAVVNAVTDSAVFMGGS